MLTNDEAAERYLGIVCQRNASMAALMDAIKAKEKQHLNGGEPGTKKIRAVAKEGMRVARAAIEITDDDYYTWPDDVVRPLKILRDAYLHDISMLNQISTEKDYDEIYYASWPDQEDAAAAAQEIRYQLGIDPDTSASCRGHETATDDLYAQMTERREYLASFG